MKFDKSIYSDTDPWFIGETRLSFLVLNFDQTFPGRSILIPKAEAADLESLDPDLLGPIMSEVVEIARHIKREFGAARMNYASLGNVVEQLHWHIIPRYDGDPNWGGPPWPVAVASEVPNAVRQETIFRIRPIIASLSR